MRNAVELWLYRRLRPLVGGSAAREVGGPTLPDDVRRGGVSRLRALAAGAVLLVAVGTGGAWFGHGWDQGGSSDPAAAAFAGPVAEVCRARADAAQARLFREEGIGPDDGIAPLLVGAAEVEECRAGKDLRMAELRSNAVGDLVAAEVGKAVLEE